MEMICGGLILFAIGYFACGAMFIEDRERKAKSGLFYGLIGKETIWTTKETICKYYFEDRSE